MNTPHLVRILSTAVTLAFVTLSGLTSCASNEELQDRMDRRNDSYSNLQERREIRQNARQDRTDAWFDRVMH